MLRRAVIAILLAGVFAAPGAAATQRSLLMPGVTYEREVQFTSHGPLALHVLRAPRPGGLYALKPVLSNDAVLGRERVTSMQKRMSPRATVAGVNGDLFNWNDGRPTGMFMESGVLATPPAAGRSSVGIAADGSLRIERVRFFGTWRGIGQRRPLNGLNQPPGPNGITLFTPAWGPATPSVAGSVEAVLFPFPPTATNLDLTAPVVQIVSGGGTPIPAGGAVLSARGVTATRLAAEAPVATELVLRLILQPDWTGITDGVGGGPALVRNGKPIFRSFESFTPDQLVPRHPRTAVGQTADGRLLLVVADGRQPGYSVGMTNFELALTMVRLGAVTASALDAGGSSTMAFDGQVLNRPSDGGSERAVAEALLVFYYGVYAPPPTAPVLSPNGDGIDERQALVYKVVRPSTVKAALIGPDSIERLIDEGPKQPGVYRFSWDAMSQAGTKEPQGRWQWVVTATDDQGQVSTINRTFWLNETLASLAVAPTTMRLPPRGGRLTATFTLTQPARVAVTVKSTNGALLKTIASRRPVGAGTARVTWDGRYGTGALAYSGRYVLRVAATNEYGTTALERTFVVRRVAGPKPKAKAKPKPAKRPAARK